ncbi:nucleoporin Nic96p [Diutina catenulata]
MFGANKTSSFGTGASQGAAAAPNASANPGAASSGFSFGANSANTAKPSTGLFGNNSAQPSTGLFGGNASSGTAPSQPSTGLFGANSSTAAKPSLFGGNTATNTATNTAAKPSLFGGNTTNTTAPAATANTANTAPAGSAATTLANPSGADLASLLANSSSSNSNKVLKDLVSSAHNLPKAANVDLGAIHLTLGELQRQSQRAAKDAPANFTKAHYLLAGSGINAETMENELSALQAVSPAHPSAEYPAAAGDLDHFIAAKKDDNVLATIEQSLAAASADFDRFIGANISIDWKQRRTQLRERLGLTSDGTPAVASAVKWNRSVAGNYGLLAPMEPSSSAARTTPRAKFEAHAQVVYRLNEARLGSAPFAVATEFGEIAKGAGDARAKQMNDAWTVLAELAGEKTAKAAQEHRFAAGYLAQPPSARTQHAVVATSCRCLETEFYNYMEEIYAKNAAKPEQFRGGSAADKVGFLVHKTVSPPALERTLCVNGVPVWASVFYMLRAGLYADAAAVVARHAASFAKIDHNFPVYLRKFVDSDTHTLPPDIARKMHAEFAHQFQYAVNDVDAMPVGFDAYKYAVYKIVGRCDPTNRTLPAALNLSIEDWLWFHLRLVGDGSDGDAGYPLAQMQASVTALGPAKFTTAATTPLYLKALMAVGLYELAVSYAYDHVSECDAVHLAVALNYYGLLRVSTLARDELLVAAPPHGHAINFARLMGSYTRTFKISDPKVASQYVILVAMTARPDEVAKSHEAVRELVLASREFGMLLGEVDEATGNQRPGLLQRQRRLVALEDVDKFNVVIPGTAARQCLEQGRIFDALTLYQLAGEYDAAVQLVNKLVAEILASTELSKPVTEYGNYARDPSKPEHESVDNNIILLAQHLRTQYQTNPTIINGLSPREKQTADTLLQVVEVRQVFVKKDWAQVLEQIERLDVVPISAQADLAKIRQASAWVQSAANDDNIKRVVPSLLIMTMTAISHLNYDILTKRYQGGNEREMTAKLRAMAKNCMIYAGMVQYKMPCETYSMLINLEASL